MVTANVKKSIRDLIIKGVQRNADRIFDISQSTQACYVPVDTGMLKKSGTIEHTDKGAIIAYRTDYASDVELGIEADIPIEGEQKIYVKKHKRRAYTTSSGKRVPATIVQGHTTIYKNKRLIRMRPKHSKFEYGDPIFRVIDKIKKREGQFYLTRALQEGIKHVGEDVAFYLRRVGNVT